MTGLDPQYDLNAAKSGVMVWMGLTIVDVLQMGGRLREYTRVRCGVFLELVNAVACAIAVASIYYY